MEGDKGKSGSRKTSRGHKSSKHRHQSSRHKSSSRSTTSSDGEKSRDKERTSDRSRRVPNYEREESARSSGVYSVQSSSSFDPIALANQRTNYFATQKTAHQQAQHPGAFPGAPSEAPSRGSKKAASGSTSSSMPQHSAVMMKSIDGASTTMMKSDASTKGSTLEPPSATHMVSPSLTKSQPPSYNSSGLTSGKSQVSSGSYDNAVIAHEVVRIDADGGTINDDVKRLAEENRAFREQLQAQNEAERLRMIEENERAQRELRASMQRQKEAQQAKEAERKKKQKRYVMIVLCIVVVAGIGLGAYFGTRSSSSAAPQSSGSAVNPSPTQSPATPTRLPTSPTNTSPYEPPNAQECENMEKGLPRGSDYQGLVNRQFEVELYAQVSSDVSSSTTVSEDLLSTLEQQIERLLRPEMVGCSTLERRRRRRYLKPLEQSRRELNNFDYLIYDFEVSLEQHIESTCTLNDQGSGPCHVLVASMDVWLQGDEPSFFVRGYVYELLNTLNLPVSLELENQFDIIVVEDVRDAATDITPSESPVSTTPSPIASPTTGPANPPTSGSCDLSEHFNLGFYYEYDGGFDQVYVVDCSIFTGTRALAIAVDESTCNFSCVGRKEPQAFGRYCASQPTGTTVQLLVEGDYSGSKIYLGTDSNGLSDGPLDCNPPLTIVDGTSPSIAPNNAPVAQPTPTPTVRPTPGPTPEPTPPPTPPPTQSPPTGNPPSSGSCDLSEYFRNDYYDEHDGGVDQTYVISCSVFTGRRGIALAVDESTCTFTCVGRKKPSEIGPFCANKPEGTTMKLTVVGDNTGSKIYLGTDAKGREQQTLECDPEMIASSNS